MLMIVGTAFWKVIFGGAFSTHLSTVKGPRAFSSDHDAEVVTEGLRRKKEAFIRSMDLEQGNYSRDLQWQPEV